MRDERKIKIRKERTPKIARRFNKKRYLRLSFHQTKRYAKQRAAQLKELGYSVRVVKSRDWGHVIYGRKKSKYEK